MVRSRFSPKWMVFAVLPFLAACTDLRATFEIKGSAHALSLIRVTGMFWEKTADYSIVAARMPDCMRRHPLSKAGLNAGVEVYSPGNDAWILKQGNQMYVVETRTCEGFAKLDTLPDNGLGVPMGVFEMRNDALVFNPAPRATSQPAAVAEQRPPVSESGAAAAESPSN